MSPPHAPLGLLSTYDVSPVFGSIAKLHTRKYNRVSLEERATRVSERDGGRAGGRARSADR